MFAGISGSTSGRNVGETRRGEGHVASQMWRKNLLKCAKINANSEKAKRATKTETCKCLYLQHYWKTSLEFVDNRRKLGDRSVGRNANKWIILGCGESAQAGY